MIEITLQEGDRLEWALKSFKRKVIQSGLFAELRRRRHYLKPSEARQLKDDEITDQDETSFDRGVEPGGELGEATIARPSPGAGIEERRPVE